MRVPRSRPAARSARVPVLAAVVLLATGCAAAPAPTAPRPVAPPPTTLPVTPAGPAVPCAVALPVPPTSGPVLLSAALPLAPTLGTSTALGLALLVARDADDGVGRVGVAGEGCGGGVVLAPAEDAGARVLAATTAVLRDAPLVLLPGTADPGALPAASRAVVERRLDAVGARERHVVAAGTTDALIAALVGMLDAHPHPDATVVLLAAADVAAQADAVASVPSGVRPLVVDLGADGLGADGFGDVVTLLRGRDPAPEVRWAATSRAAADAFLALDVDGLGLTRWTAPDGTGASGAGAGGAGGGLWLGDVREPGAALTAAAVAARRGAAFVAVDGEELRAGVERTSRIRALAAALPEGAPVVLVGGGEDAAWQLDTVLEGTPLPGGGFLPLEDRRIVALYGSPGAPSLGILGEQDLEATLVRARELAAGYADAPDGRLAVPGLDVIVTVASSAAEPTGDYSRRIPIDRLRPLVDRAGEEGVAVMLDLQPGRTDFLTQAQEYEELLREPHVHLALDPEWRIGPTERHLQRIGSVEAAEVQEVADWLAALVRRERLPQKVFMLHQFILPMLPDRDTVVVPPELVGVVHVDGQGPLPTKDRTYAAMTDGAEERWAWGWKNFTRIDDPLATPAQSLDRTPVPVIITYQ